MMNLLWFPLLATMLSNPMSPSIRVSLGEEVDPYAFRLPIEATLPYAQVIDSQVLGYTPLNINYESRLYTYTIQITLEGSLVRPLIGISPFISQWSLQSDDMFIDVFNPTRYVVDLSSFAIQINDQAFTFTSNLTLNPLKTQRIVILQKEASRFTIDATYDLWVEPDTTITSIAFIKINDGQLLDRIPIQTDMETRYGWFSVQEWRFIRSSKVAGPESIYQPNSWLPRPHHTIKIAHEFMTHMVTPLQQATAWATYVMYGAGMFAAGRVEAAFEALRSEYRFMDATSQSLLLSQPSNTITGINEQGRSDQSTFREAIVRYNYLAARVPGASGLTIPPRDTIPWDSVLYLSLFLIGFVSVVLLLKISKKQHH